MAKKKEAQEGMTEECRLEKEMAVRAAISLIEKDFGEGTVIRLGDRDALVPCETIPTGSISLDLALGIGGIPKGRICEIYGPEGGGKTTLALHMIAEAQKAGGIAAFIDAEHALDPAYAAKIGVDTGSLYVSQPDSGEQALSIVDSMVRSGGMTIIVVDSVAALTPQAEIDGEMGDAHMGLQARLMSQALRKLTATVSKTKCVVIFINQLREKIGIMFGNPETTPGGRALKFYSSIRLDIRRTESIKKGGQVIGNIVRVKVVKNKMAAPFRETKFDVIFGMGIDMAGDLVQTAEDEGIIFRSGSWYSYGGERFANGKDAATQYVTAHPEIGETLRASILEKAGLNVAEASENEGEYHESNGEEEIPNK